nr:MAG TPA: hypothetical protein [Caudoviricetes sp.]
MSMIRNNTTVFEVKSDYTGTGARLNINSSSSATTLSMNDSSIVIQDGTDNIANRTYIDDNSIVLRDSAYNN